MVVSSTIFLAFESIAIVYVVMTIFDIGTGNNLIVRILGLVYVVNFGHKAHSKVCVCQIITSFECIFIIKPVEAKVVCIMS